MNFFTLISLLSISSLVSAVAEARCTTTDVDRIGSKIQAGPIHGLKSEFSTYFFSWDASTAKSDFLFFETELKEEVLNKYCTFRGAFIFTSKNRKLHFSNCTVQERVSIYYKNREFIGSEVEVLDCSNDTNTNIEFRSILSTKSINPWLW